jgi:hypothetical protein
MSRPRSAASFLFPTSGVPAQSEVPVFENSQTVALGHLGHVWDSALAQAGAAGSAGQGWQTSLAPSMGGGLTSTVSYTDATGAVWLFPYTGAPTARSNE